MKKILTLLLMYWTCCTLSHAQYYSYNIDYKTAAAMSSVYATEAGAESYYGEQLDKIMENYTQAGAAAAGIFSSKYLDRKALTNMGIWVSPDENYYYRRIYKMVSSRIMPKIWRVSGQMIHSPENALYWGSYLGKVSTETQALCQQFESIVTNGRLSFRDIAFLELNPEFKAIFDMARAGGADWKTILNTFSRVPGNFTKENLTKDINILYKMGSSIAQTGATNIGNGFVGASSFSGSIWDKANGVYNLAQNSYSLFSNLKNHTGSTVNSLLGGTANLSQLWNMSNYNMTNWVTDYMRETLGQYYTQRWYIYSVDSGSETLCRYEPPTDNNSIIKGSHWYRISTTDPYFYPSIAQYASIRQNSENHAGWSQSRVDQLNKASKDGSTYSIDYSLGAYKITSNGKLSQKAYAYWIDVTRSWYRTEEVYEDHFDSYTMDINTFRNQLQLKCDELNENDEGKRYYIGSDAKNYYQTTDAAKLKGCETVIISVTCHDNISMGEGNTQYKCSSCGSSLNNHTKECVMRTTLSSSESLDTSELDRQEQELQTQIANLQSQIDALEAGNAAIVKQIANSSVEESAVLRQKYNDNKTRINALKQEQNTLKTRLGEVQQAKAEAQQGEEVQTDDYYRIPAIMHDLKTAYNLTWLDDGHWEGWTFVRTASIPNIKGVVTFEAKVSLVRKPKYFLGIKIHRAIIGISWKLSASFTDTHVADMIELDPNMDDAAKAAMVNEHISAVVKQYPNCEVTHEYIKSSDVAEDDTEDTFHLLWSSDRLEVAREIDTRLTKIYSDLVALEKFMNYKLRIVDVWNKINPLDRNDGHRQNLLEQAHSDWVDAARNTVSNPFRPNKSNRQAPNSKSPQLVATPGKDPVTPQTEKEDNT